MKSCIKCGTKTNEKTDVKELGPIDKTDKLGKYFVKCPKCAFAGPIYPKREDAIWAWDFAHKISPAPAPAPEVSDKKGKPDA